MSLAELCTARSTRWPKSSGNFLPIHGVFWVGCYLFFTLLEICYVSKSSTFGHLNDELHTELGIFSLTKNSLEDGKIIRKPYSENQCPSMPIIIIVSCKRIFFFLTHGKASSYSLISYRKINKTIFMEG